ncbi:Transcription initiation factor TFIID subunit 6 [Trichuris trichiura]|uniref:Transcription initiation factor TFIID subunit 6 n=1 Tax=Trichuris trichiura TaxID=36087 RepID=A0A077YZP0_TRITR|nr:Transcription initiation factor TFIID subunit 6 [Trichuris trichiura]
MTENPVGSAVAKLMGFRELSQAVMRELDDSVHCMLHEVIEAAKIFTKNGKKQEVTCADINHALRLKGQEPLNEFLGPSFGLFRLAVCESQPCGTSKDKVIDFDEVVQSPPPTTEAYKIKGHWLAIEGVQPLIPENPAPDSAELLPAAKLPHLEKNCEQDKELCLQRGVVQHKLGTEALQNIASMKGVESLLPRLSVFIKEGVVCSIAEANIIQLTYLMRIANALNSNLQVNMERFLHDILPAVLSCIVSRKLCLKTETGKQWGLRQYAGNLLIQLCRRYNSSTYCLQYRVTDFLAKRWLDESASMAMAFGALYTIGNMGHDAIRNVILPHLPAFGERVRVALSLSDEAERAGAEQPLRSTGAMHPSGLTSVESEPAISWTEIHAKKYDPAGCSEMKKLVVDRERITYVELREIVKRTFAIQSDFVLFYLMPEGYGTTGRYLPILSEWDLNAAVFVSKAGTLVLKVDVKPTETARQGSRLIR